MCGKYSMKGSLQPSESNTYYCIGMLLLRQLLPHGRKSNQVSGQEVKHTVSLGNSKVALSNVCNAVVGAGGRVEKLVLFNISCMYSRVLLTHACMIEIK